MGYSSHAWLAGGLAVLGAGAAVFLSGSDPVREEARATPAEMRGGSLAAQPLQVALLMIETGAFTRLLAVDQEPATPVQIISTAVVEQLRDPQLHTPDVLRSRLEPSSRLNESVFAEALQDRTVQKTESRVVALALTSTTAVGGEIKLVLEPLTLAPTEIIDPLEIGSVHPEELTPAQASEIRFIAPRPGVTVLLPLYVLTDFTVPDEYRGQEWWRIAEGVVLRPPSSFVYRDSLGDQQFGLQPALDVPIEVSSESWFLTESLLSR